MSLPQKVYREIKFAKNEKIQYYFHVDFKHKDANVLPAYLILTNYNIFVVDKPGLIYEGYHCLLSISYNLIIDNIGYNQNRKVIILQTKDKEYIFKISEANEEEIVVIANMIECFIRLFRLPQISQITHHILDPELKKVAEKHFLDDDYDTAIRNAFVLLEERMREVVGIGYDKWATGLVKEVFDHTKRDMNIGELIPEKEGVKLLYLGAIQYFRNPASHRFVKYDKEEAYEILIYVNLLLRLLDKAFRSK